MSGPWLDDEPIPMERLWLPTTLERAVVDEQGYLLPREHYLQHRCLAGDELDDLDLAMFRGESGSGKTFALAEMILRLRAADRFVVCSDLTRVDSRSALFDELRPVLDARVGDDGAAYVFFDDVEKSQLKAIERHLVDVLGKLAPSKVRVRIAYRAGSLTRRAEERFCGLFASSAVLDLLPLTRRVVLDVLARVRQPADVLLERLEQQGLVPLLVQPVTLRMIERLIAKDRPIHAMTRRELYEQSCQLLCEPRANEPSSLDVDQRLAIARRLAAISVFCNRPAFYHRAPDGQMPSALLPLRATLGGAERVARGGMVAVTEAHAREVLLRTGLFSAIDQDAMEWRHNSIADYLAAEQVRVNELPIRQVNELVRLGDPSAPVLPQLEGVLGWLAADPRFGLVARMVVRAPLTLLRSDLIELPELTRRDIVRTLLEAAQREMLDVWNHELSRRIARASYPALLDDVRPWIHGRAGNPLARVFAIRVVDACGFGAPASPMLLSIALDDTEPLVVRHQAAITIRDHGDRSTQLGLRMLALASDEADERDDLKGEALRALWPTELTSRELFASLTPPRDDTYLGAYEVFLGWELPRSLTRQALPDGLEWVLRQPPLQASDNGIFSRLIDEVLRFALRHLDDDVVRGRVAEAFLLRRREYAHLLSRVEGAETDLNALLGTERRRALIEAMVEKLEPSDPHYLIGSTEPPLLAQDDTQWLLACLRRANDYRAAAWIEMIGLVAPAGTDEDRERILEALAEDERMKEPLRWFAGPIELASKAATRMREEQERQRRNANTPPRRTLDKAALELVESACAGDLEAFGRVHRALAGRPQLFGVDIASLPGWAELTQEQRDQLVGTARGYLLRREDHRADWLGASREWPEAAITGLRALHLVARVDGHAAFDELPDDVWSRWIGIIVAWPFRSQDHDGIRRAAIARVVRAAPGATSNAVAVLLAQRDSSIASTLELFPTPWPPPLVEAVANSIPDARPESVDDLLRAMFFAEPQRAETAAWQLANDGGRGLSVRATAYVLILLRTARASRLRAMEQLVTRARPLTHAVFARLAREMYSRTPILRNLSEDELATLFIELERRYPLREEPEFRDMHRVRSPEQLARLRRAVLGELWERSSTPAVAALRTIVAAFNERPDLQRALVAAEVKRAESDWQPPTPAMLLNIVEDATRSYVETGEDLAELIVESLLRLDRRLNGTETPMGELLWNTDASPRPKDEAALSIGVRIAPAARGRSPSVG